MSFFVGDTVAFGDYFAFAVVELLFDEAVQLFGVDLEHDILFHIDVGAANICERQRIALGIGVDRVAYGDFGKLVLYLSEVHFYLVSNNTPTETQFGDMAERSEYL